MVPLYRGFGKEENACRFGAALESGCAISSVLPCPKMSWALLKMGSRIEESPYFQGDLNVI